MPSVGQQAYMDVLVEWNGSRWVPVEANVYRQTLEAVVCICTDRCNHLSEASKAAIRRVLGRETGALDESGGSGREGGS